MNNTGKKTSFIFLKITLILILSIFLMSILYFAQTMIKDEYIVYDTDYEEFRIPIDHIHQLLRKKISCKPFSKCKVFLSGEEFSVVRRKTEEVDFVEYETVTIGKYPQNQIEEEPIEWLVIDKTNGKTLLLSKYYLDAKQYDGKSENITWEQSELRKWLNEYFYQTAFNLQEQEAIEESTVVSDFYPYNGRKDRWDGIKLPSKVTNDKVFILDPHEKIIYLELFGNDYHSEPTEYAKQNAKILACVEYEMHHGKSSYQQDIFVDWSRFGYVSNIGYQVYWSYNLPYNYDYNYNDDYAIVDERTKDSSLYIRPAIWVDSNYIKEIEF